MEQNGSPITKLCWSEPTASVEQAAQSAGLRRGLPNELLRVEGLEKVFLPQGFGGRGTPVRAVDGVSFDIARGETLALVGESGCGKTTIARCILRLVEPTRGSVRFGGTELTGLSGKRLRSFRRRMQVVFQDPYASLDPRMSVSSIVEEPLRIHNIVDANERRRRVNEMLELVGMSGEMARRKPHAFSGGQRQRIAIARCLVLNPELVILDEPVSALDVSIQAQVLNLLSSLQTRLNLTYLIIVHDLAIAEYAAHRIAVLYLGRIVELAERSTLFRSPLHPYTVALLSAVPIPDPDSARRRQRIVLQGELPAATGLVTGCRFRNRCPVGHDRQLCRDQDPALTDDGRGHWIACHFPGELRLSVSRMGHSPPPRVSWRDAVPMETGEA